MKEIAEDLVNRFRIILMNEDTECGNEVLCSLIAKKMAKITVKEKIQEVESFQLIYDNISYGDKRISFLNKVIKEINEL